MIGYELGQIIYNPLRQPVFDPLASTDRKSDSPVRTVESMRQLAAQLAEAERVGLEADKTIAAANASRTPTVSSDTRGSHQRSMLSDTYGRHHNYLRISLTERQAGRKEGRSHDVCGTPCASRDVFLRVT